MTLISRKPALLKHHVFTPSFSGKTIALFSLSLLLTGTLSACQSGGPSSPDTEKQSKLQTETDRDDSLVYLFPEALGNNPIQLITVENRIVSQELQTVGEIKADQNRVFHISSLTAGRIAADRVNLGQLVHTGQVLAVIQNPDTIKIQATSIHELHANEIATAQAKTKMLLAQQNHDREKHLYQQGITPQKEWIAAEANLKLAKAELAGLKEHRTHIQSEAKAMLASYGVRFNTQSEHLQTGSPLVAPRAGVVTRKNITVGDTVSPGQVLYELADLSQVWLDLTVYSKDVSRLMPGYTVQFKSDSLPEKTFTGRINYIQPDASRQSQTFVVRVFLPNPDNILKPGMFGQARISHKELQRSLPFVPNAALQSYGKEFFVFIPAGKNQYRKQVVQIASRVTDGVFIEKGLEPGQSIVTQGSFGLKAELVKNQQTGSSEEE